ncbi:MAG: hypothetical protein NC253_04515 [Ruminococcus sp.]|nr:hypothetical protein [Ruminococcus sp.]MCM1479469.1 hypothetical protein [Muribaculaceae bacterium]
MLSMEDNGDNRLKIVIALPKNGKQGEGAEELLTGNKKLNDLVMKSYPVYEDTDNVYEIIFERYIIYQCRNESYTAYDSREISKGKYLIIFEKSELLNYYKDVIFDFDGEENKKNRKHYGIYTENHIIDVISNEPPVISKISLKTK